MKIIYLENRIETDYSGYKQLIDFYHNAKILFNETVFVDFSRLEWIDANMSALFNAVLHKLEKENNLQFTTNFELVASKFDVLLRNGFVQTGGKVYDIKKSTMPSMSFDCKDKKGFINYVEKELLGHRGMPKLSENLTSQICDDLIEVFCNVNYHANTTEPFFVGGQFYPKLGFLRFTMVDLGDGFLPKIQTVTKGKISNSLEAIQWAIEGNTTKRSENVPGGLGISRINKYCQNNGGILQIITGNGFWDSSQVKTIFAAGRQIPNPFAGTTINLHFKYQ